MTGETCTVLRERVVTRIPVFAARAQVEVYNDNMERHYDSKRMNHFDIAYPEKSDRLKEVKNIFLIFAWLR